MLPIAASCILPLRIFLLSIQEYRLAPRLFPPDFRRIFGRSEAGGSCRFARAGEKRAFLHNSDSYEGSAGYGGVIFPSRPVAVVFVA